MPVLETGSAGPATRTFELMQDLGWQHFERYDPEFWCGLRLAPPVDSFEWTVAAIVQEPGNRGPGNEHWVRGATSSAAAPRGWGRGRDAGCGGSRIQHLARGTRQETAALLPALRSGSGQERPTGTFRLGSDLIAGMLWPPWVAMYSSPASWTKYGSSRVYPGTPISWMSRPSISYPDGPRFAHEIGVAANSSGCRSQFERCRLHF